ncbi:hypothetical protein Tco_1152847 [Tanacetum coccineum]|uniref:Uncharacterized protein n=1 Tax=Tanacetum coccineum TaxID=301880 RepID=A0ABQ4YPW4_9ASTR
MSVTDTYPALIRYLALRIPIIKKVEYDLWSMKMRHVAPKTSTCLQNAEETIEKAPHIYCFCSILIDLGGKKHPKKLQKNLLKQQFETFTIGSREELDSAYERFQHILSMLELHDATVSIEDANLKFLRSYICVAVWLTYDSGTTD